MALEDPKYLLDEVEAFANRYKGISAEYDKEDLKINLYDKAPPKIVKQFATEQGIKVCNITYNGKEILVWQETCIKKHDGLVKKLCRLLADKTDKTIKLGMPYVPFPGQVPEVITEK